MADAPDTVSLNADTAPLNDALDSAGKALADFANGPVAQAGASIEAAVTKSFTSVSYTISRAAAAGKLSIDTMVNGILADFERVALSQFIVKPIEGLVANVAGALLQTDGARAAGGPVSAGASYLVGERGPEIFTPAANGTIAPDAASAQSRPQIVLNVQARDAASFLKSQSQIAAMMTRALARGQRNL